MTGRARVRKVVVVAAVVSAVVLGGCGGGDDGPSGPGFAASAGAICARYDAQLAAISRPVDRAMAAVLLDKVVAIDQGRVDELAALDPPESSAAKAASLLEAHDRLLETIGKAAAALRSGEKDEYAGLVEDAADEVAEVRSQARALSLERCAAIANPVTAPLARLPLPEEPPKDEATETTATPADTTVPGDDQPVPETSVVS